MSANRGTLIRTGRSAGVRGLVLVALTGFIVVVYVLIVVVLGLFVGGSALVLSIVATAVVAIAFEPVRLRLQRWANGIVFGKRASPYEVLSETTGRLTTAENVAGLFGRMAVMLRSGVGGERAGVWVTSGSGFTTAATDPPDDHLIADSSATLPGSATLIQQDGEVLGALTVEMGRDAVLTPNEKSLVADLAGSAALVLRKLRLDAALEGKAAELQESRRRLVDAQDEERRRLERDLHDGAQQLVVALKVKLGLAEQVATREGTGRAVALIGEMARDAQLAVDQIRSLARGIYPPLLQAEGLGAAVLALAALSPLDVRIEADVAHRHPLQVEGAVYFCIAEALTNAAKHGRDPVTVTVADGAGSVMFEVMDSGPGFDEATAEAGTGLANMADRVEALDGDLVVSSTPGGSTTVTGMLPVSAPAGVGP